MTRVRRERMPVADVNAGAIHHDRAGQGNVHARVPVKESH